MKIAFIHSDKKIGTGAHFINDLIATKLRERSVRVENFYPRFRLTDTPVHFKGVNNILFFYSLLEKRDEILRCDIIQGTTYTPIAFLRFSRPVVSHFGSTTIGFLQSVPRTSSIEDECARVFHRLKRDGVIRELNLRTRRPLHDIATVEQYAAERADYLIATSIIVKHDLVRAGIAPDKIHVIHNAMEDYWFSAPVAAPAARPSIVFVGRVGEDVFTFKLKGLGRMIWLFEQFPDVQKLAVLMTRNAAIAPWIQRHVPRTSVAVNVAKDAIPAALAPHAGGIAVLPSRYEGFSLSLIEMMSQGLVPVSFPVGVAPEIIRNGENGYLVDRLEDAVVRIQELLVDTALRHAMAAQARATAQRFTSDALVDQTLALYRSIVSRDRDDRA